MAERKPNRPFTASSRRISQSTDQLARLKSAKGHLSELGPASETWVSPPRADSRSASRTSESCPQQQAKFGEPEAMFCPMTSAFADEKLYARAPLNSRVAVLSCKKFDDECDIPPIQTLGYNLQEYALVEDVLYVMMGIEGRYITQADVPPTNPGDLHRPQSFLPVDGIDASLRELVLRILPLASFHSQISRFVLERSKFEYGLVNHALCSALRELQKEYLLLIAQLEYQFRSNVTFTLQKLWFYVHPAVNTMSLLADLTTELEAVAAAGDKEEDAMMEISRSDIDESDATKISLAAKGGSVLTVISRRMAKLSGDLTAKRLHAYLLSKASVPYFSLLRSWIHHGIIRDPCLEFMVEEHQNVRKENLGQDYNDAYWEMRYTLRDGYVPPFLEPLKHQILLAGKYLNVIQGCGLALPPTAATAIPQDRRDGPAIRDVLVGNMEGVAVDESRYVADIEYAYRTANQALLTLLIKDQQLLPRLRSLKHYFLLDQSDFFTHLMSTASEELAKKYRQVSLTKLQSLLELVLRNPASVAFSDPFKEDLKVEMSTTGLVEQLLKINSMAGLGVDTAAAKNMDMLPLEAGLKFSEEIAAVASSNEGLTGIEALTFDYRVDFPLSLVISRKSLTKYQLLFRLIVLFKHAESLLSQAWLEHAKARTWRSGELSDDVHRWRKRVFGLRGQMLNFVQQLAYYVCFEVLEPKWRELQEGLGKVTTVDQLLQTHSDFLDTCLKECMLTNSKLLTIFNHAMNVCIVFPKYTDWLRSALEATGSESVSPAAEKALAKFEHGFSKYSRLLVDALNFYSSTETSQFLCLVTRLDFNHYYTRQDAL